MWTKICGITRLQDALHASRAGADAIGMVFVGRGRRAVPAVRAALIAGGLPRSLEVVGVFVNPRPEHVRRVIALGAATRLQFHGTEDNDFCASFGLPFIKAIAMTRGVDVVSAAAAYPDASAILLDSVASGTKLPGGTGKRFDWQRAAGLAPQLSVPLILAGGLNPDNVAEAIATVAPAGVDVSSGVEAGIKDCPSAKDAEAVTRFIENARHAGLPRRHD